MSFANKIVLRGQLGPENVIFFFSSLPECTCMGLNAYFGEGWDKIGGNFRDEVLCVRSCSRSSCTHLVQKNKKQQPRDIKAQRLWKRWPVILLLPRPLQPAEPLSPGVWSVCGAWRGRGTTQRTWKAQQTSRHWHANIHTHTHTFFLFHVSVSHNLSLLCFGQKGSKHKNQQCTHTPAVPPRSKSPIHLNNGEEESSGARLSVAPPPTLHFWRCQPICLSDKIREGATFKAEEEEKVMFE